MNNSSFVYDSVRNIPTAPDQVWEEYIRVHPDAAQFRSSTILFREELGQIFDQSIASSRHAAATGRGTPPPPRSRPHDSLPLPRGREYTISRSDTLTSDSDYDHEISAPIRESPTQPVAVTDQVTPRVNAEDNHAASVSYQGRKRNRYSSQTNHIEEMLNIMRSMADNQTKNLRCNYDRLCGIFKDMNEKFPAMDLREKVKLKALFCKTPDFTPLYTSSSDAEKSLVFEMMLELHAAGKI